MLSSRGAAAISLSNSSYVCLGCRVKASTENLSRTSRRPRKEKGREEHRNRQYDKDVHRSNRQRTQADGNSLAHRFPKSVRTFHTSAAPKEESPATSARDLSDAVDPFTIGISKPEKPDGIRAQLRRWQEENSGKDLLNDKVDMIEDGDGTNDLTRLSDDSSIRGNTREDDEKEALSYFMQSASDRSADENNATFLHMGDLVEIDFSSSERESRLAVFVRRIGAVAQLYNITGRWIHVPEKNIQYSIPGWAPPQIVQPLLDHLPDHTDLTDFDKLMNEAFMKDLSVPRDIAAPIVTKLLDFAAKSQEIYRKNASILDNAHDILAHEFDLRYASIQSAATKLLGRPSDDLTPTALYAVRQALTRAGEGFNFDRRSHRLTGYLQIRGKRQTKMLNDVREWVREWQDHLAKMAPLSPQQKLRVAPSAGARKIYDFIEKARKIVLASRQDREPTPMGAVSPSKKVFPLTSESECVRMSKGTEFNSADGSIVKFLEGWSLTNLLHSSPRLVSVPPIILQATGLYKNMRLNHETGSVFLQEIGTILPYENRVRFDEHLLLPSSGNSQALMALSERLGSMKNEPTSNFVDNMADLRRDWGELPVYCVDSASALEIDDGFSVQKTDVEGQYWVHVHIANPTAFLERDHPLSRLARHMGESIYMPERNYTMLPQWVSQRHFSLAPNRPCLTFSAKIDRDGRTLERTITPGTIRNVKNLTNEDVDQVLGHMSHHKSEQLVLTVGGEAPASKRRRSIVGELSAQDVENLKVVQSISGKLAGIRRAAGGLFYETSVPEMNVWQNSRVPGLAWDHPYHLGSRVVEGDPVLQMRTRPMTNYFASEAAPSDILVREMMLLACELAATWCSERQIPAIFRGSVDRPDTQNSEEFFRDVLAPATAQTEDGEYPMHLAMEYLGTFGATQLATRPFTHRILGLDSYGKVTSPLRRYGDMVIHWQIEAALREEAKTGKSLVTQDPKADRSFLPHSEAALKNIIVGLGPREKIIQHTKAFADRFWTCMLLFRAHHYGQGVSSQPPLGPSPLSVDKWGLDDPLRPYKIHPDSPLPRRLTAYFPRGTAIGTKESSVGTMCILVELNIPATMVPPWQQITYFGEEKTICPGDLWSVELRNINVHHRACWLSPVSLINRIA